MQRKNYSATTPDPKNELIKKLKEELYYARRTVVALTPTRLRDLIRTYTQCKSRKESSLWMNSVIDEIIEYATRNDPEEFYNGLYSDCPLCGERADTAYSTGFKLPEGLARHLEGSHGAHKCRVMTEIKYLTHDYWNSQFSEQEEINRENDQRILQKRRETETLYKIDPFSTPLLIDEGWRLFFASPRTPEGLLWAENRLKELGFLKVAEGSVVSMVANILTHVVYADYRKEGNIDCSVWKIPLPQKVTVKTMRPVSTFSLSDKLTSGLKKRYVKILADLS